MENSHSRFGSTSLTMISQLKTSQAEAWERMCELYGPMIYRWSRKAGLSSTDAADVVQEVFGSVIAYVGNFQTRKVGSFRGWLKTITKHRIVDHLRACLRQPRAIGGTVAQMELLMVAEQLVQSRSTLGHNSRETSDLGAAIDSIRGHFSDQTWRAFWLSVMGQHTSTEIAAELGMSGPAVRLAKARVLRRLRKTLENTESGTIPATGDIVN